MVWPRAQKALDNLAGRLGALHLHQMTGVFEHSKLCVRAQSVLGGVLRDPGHAGEPIGVPVVHWVNRLR